MFIAANPQRWLGRVVGNGHCVPYVQLAADMPHTSHWRQGKRARDSDIPEGTVIATFGPDGTYENRTDGSSHAAVFLAQMADGLRVIDQWRGQVVHERTIRWRGGAARPANDGDRFHAVVLAQPPGDPSGALA